MSPRGELRKSPWSQEGLNFARLQSCHLKPASGGVTTQLCPQASPLEVLPPPLVRVKQDIFSSKIAVLQLIQVESGSVSKGSLCTTLLKTLGVVVRMQIPTKSDSRSGNQESASYEIPLHTGMKKLLEAWLVWFSH